MTWNSNEECIKWMHTTMTITACLLIHLGFPDPCWMLRGPEVILIIIGALVIVFLLGWREYYMDKENIKKGQGHIFFPDVWKKEED